MKETIAKVLEEYKGSQVNLDAAAAREAIADQIADEIEKKFDVVAKPLDGSLDQIGWHYE